MSFGVHSFGVARQADRARAAANIKAMFFMRIFHFKQMQAAFGGGLIAQTLDDGDGLEIQKTGCLKTAAHMGFGMAAPDAGVLCIRLRYLAASRLNQALPAMSTLYVHFLFYQILILSSIFCVW